MEEKIRKIIEMEKNASLIWLGTVAGLTPSGKYYTPWCCSNVTNDEIEEDEKFFNELERVLEKFGYMLEIDGDEVFAVKIEAEEEE